MSHTYTPYDFAMLTYSENLSVKQENEVLERVWLNRSELLSETYQNEKQFFLKAYKRERHKAEGLLEHIDEVNLILDDMESKFQVKGPEFDEVNVESVFKVIKLRLMLIPGRTYCRFKVRTLIGVFGYKKRSALLVQFMEQMINELGLKTYLRESEICRIGEVPLDAMIIFKLDEAKV